MVEDQGIYDVENEPEFHDFIGELIDGFPVIVEKILQFLTPRQLCVIPCVSKAWGRALADCPVARKRRDKHLRKVKKLRKSVGQENWPIKKRTPVATDGRRDALSDIRNVYRTRKPKNHRSTLSSVQTPNTRQRERDNRSLRAMR